MTAGECICRGSDCLAAKEAIQKGRFIVELIDESHFGASIKRCEVCAQSFLTMFCEYVDWADGDDPQRWLAVPVTEDEVRRLRTANVAADENAILGIVTDERRFLFHDMPKGTSATLTWMTRVPYIPGHD